MASSWGGDHTFVAEQSLNPVCQVDGEVVKVKSGFPSPAEPASHHHDTAIDPAVTSTIQNWKIGSPQS